MSSSASVIAAAVLAYLVVVRVLRFRRVRYIQEAYGAKPLTPWVAQRILHLSVFYEVPFTMYLGTVMALFKVYGIVSAQRRRRVRDVRVLTCVHFTAQCVVHLAKIR